MAKSLELSLTIEGMSSVFPRAMTDPRTSYKISVRQLEDHNKILQNRMNILLCYNKNPSDEGDSGWHVGGWIKESLGRALLDEPVFAGRIRGCDDGGFEIVSNDSGVRLVEAQTPLSLVEFLQYFKEKHQVEAQLVYWNDDVDITNAQFSPLFSIQVTNFQCGGYTVGISYSLLLADPLFMAKFLKRWAEIHRKIAYEGKIPKMPVFYAPNFKRVESFPPATNITSKSNPGGKTAIFNISTDDKLDSGDEICKYFVLLCIEETENKFSTKIASTFTLITKEPKGNAKVEKLSKQGICVKPKSLRYDLRALRLKDMRINEIALQRENLPFHVSDWVGCNAVEGMVLAVILSPIEGKSGMNVYITFS